MLLAQNQSQRQILSTSMQQSLHLLQLPISELQEYLTDTLVENPLVDLNQLAPDVSALSETLSSETPIPARNTPASDSNLDTDQLLQNTPDDMLKGTLVADLLQQLPQISRFLPERYLPLCRFLIESLDRRGYLDEPIDLLASIMNVSVEDALQALYAVQSLSPAGTAARTLEECLLLQLAEGPYFNSYTIDLVKNHLDLLACRDFAALSKILGLPRDKVEKYYHVIRQLNPIPSNGFCTAQLRIRYIVPEAYVEVQGECLSVQYNRQASPKLVISSDYQSLFDETQDPVTHNYLAKQYAQVKKLRTDLERRESTIVSVIRFMLTVQKDYLLHRVPAPLPLSVQDLADHLGMNPSTISRAIKDKYISVQDHCIPLKDLLSAQIGKGLPISSMLLKVYMEKLISAEDPCHPLSDQSLTDALHTMGIDLSRRTTAQYREKFQIPPASRRRKR